jgi:2-octaprenyl-6-methoxyphenol hydroxylase
MGMNADYDLLIVGGGMVGASLARALEGSGLRIAALEAASAEAEVQPSYDDRVIALAWGSRLILEGIGCWDRIAAEAETIRHIHISDRGHFGATRLDHRDQRLPALGYVVTARALGRTLLEDIQAQQDLDWICPAGVADFRVEPECVRITADMPAGRRELSTRLLVAADGGDSPIRSRLRLPLQQWQYGHTAIIANLSPDLAHGGTAYERFTDTGPLALLPMSEGRCSLIWTQRDEAVEEIKSLDDADFLARLQDRFGYRLGRLRAVGRRSAYPLRLLRVKEMVRPRVVVIGNAAHTLHPVAGQGLNLGLRDVALLAEVLVQARRQHEDPGAFAVLRRYSDGRRGDQARVTLITDLLARIFTNPLPPIRLARDLGLVALDLTPPLKHEVARQFMGLRGRRPRLARGLPLG